MDEMELGGGCWKLASARKRPDLLSVIADVDPDGGGWRRCSVARVGAALEGLNDDHAAAATGAFVCLSIVRRGFDRGYSCSQQLACACDVLSTTGAGKEPVMADAMETFGQGMKKGTADEFAGCQ